jgi:hypothetical protein
MPALFDVIAVTIKAPHTKRIIAERKTEKNAEAIVNMAVMRRGVEEEFFDAVPHPADLTPIAS